jgi:hypothetical protein
MLLNFSDNTPFATGVAVYQYLPMPGGDDTLRILIQVAVEDDLREAVLDTGGQYFFCTQELAKQIAAGPKEKLGDKEINLSGILVKGSLCRLDIILMSDEGGTSLRFQVTAFLPNEDQNLPENFLPYSYLGLHACMERVRFGVDPSYGEDRFYFGECSG